MNLIFATITPLFTAITLPFTAITLPFTAIPPRSKTIMSADTTDSSTLFQLPMHQYPPSLDVQSPPAYDAYSVPSDAQQYNDTIPPSFPPTYDAHYSAHTNAPPSDKPTTIPIICLQRTPMPVVCPACGCVGLTEIHSRAGHATHLSAFLCFYLCLCGVFLPYVTRGTKDIKHTCASCEVALATCHRSGTTEVHRIL
ncbi:LITAF-like zinc finger domain-containing [Pyrenophora seminiperda CCB06]|uniref:LITAF-like zinc finger domain-containing n=1 Tax=Pyrenophora seminiperda CCB06 TaxID=1302712 RepID=A0A3M7MBB1_9PLEO|nr:LITAF-like zinc finger domain-containing [Pyrenophora seminiperda CCB06]